MSIVLDDVQSARTITLAFILFELFPLELFPSQKQKKKKKKKKKNVSALLVENRSIYLHETFYEYQSTLVDVQSARISVRSIS